MSENWLQPEMNGTDDDIMRALLVSIANVTTGPQFFVIRAYQAELWARGVTKSEFIAWSKIYDGDIQ